MMRAHGGTAWKVAIVCAAALVAHAAAAKPAFCKDLECPKFTVVKKISDNIELRKYEPASWVSTTVKATDIDRAMSGSFMKLFNYISGTNAASAKVEMTSPVLTKVEPGAGPFCGEMFTISFYNPWKYQGKSAAPAPKPTDAAVKITSTPEMELYTLSYGGYSNAGTSKAKVQELVAALEAAKLPFDAGVWYTGGYDSPYTIFGRHNEVFVPVKAPAKAATTKPAAAGRRLF
ncbi:MAG: regulatory factor, effector binding domain-containing protein [Monoraphidium minutum]|nr:MAG: regulatory factor, effector binding domain-containing protein [Monoraphidium minutum]